MNTDCSLDSLDCRVYNKKLFLQLRRMIRQGTPFEANFLPSVYQALQRCQNCEGFMGNYFCNECELFNKVFVLLSSKNSS